MDKIIKIGMILILFLFVLSGFVIEHNNNDINDIVKIIFINGIENDYFEYENILLILDENKYYDWSNEDKCKLKNLINITYNQSMGIDEEDISIFINALKESPTHVLKTYNDIMNIILINMDI